jgi:hypothetical protein
MVSISLSAAYRRREKGKKTLTTNYNPIGILWKSIVFPCRQLLKSGLPQIVDDGLVGQNSRNYHHHRRQNTGCFTGRANRGHEAPLRVLNLGLMRTARNLNGRYRIRTPTVSFFKLFFLQPVILDSE